MGRKSTAETNGLVELIVDKWDGGKKTIVYVTEEVNRVMQEKGLHVTFSRESIRRVIRSHEEQIEDLRKATEAAKAMAEILKDNPGTELEEAAIATMTSLVAKELRNVDSFEFENPNDMIKAMKELATARLKLSEYRTKAVKALEKAKQQLKTELQKEIQSDPELLERLCKIIDSTEVK